MAGAMRKMAVYLGLVEDDRYDDYDDGYDEHGDATNRHGDRFGDRTERTLDRGHDRVYAERGVADRGVADRGGADRAGADRGLDLGYDSPERSRPMAAVRDEATVGGRAPVTAMADRRTSGATALAPAPAPASDLTQITTIHPRTYNEAKAIGEHFRGGTPVIMNLTEMADSDAKRLVDFAAGLVFGLHGTIERVTNKVFLLSPANVTVTAEDKARMRESGFFNQS